MPGQASLPTDVLLQVVDDLRDDPSTLRHCALACRTLYDCVRPILFNIITMDEPWTSRASQLSNLLDSSPSESLGALVKHLKIVGPEGNPVERVLAPEDVLIVADKLPDVRILTLEFVTFDWLEDLFCIVAAFPHLKALRINGLLVGDPFFKRFFDNGGFLSDSKPSRPFPTTGFPQLRSLDIRWGRDDGEEPFLYKLREYKASLRLQSLVIAFGGGGIHQERPYVTFIPDVGKSLHHLSITGQFHQTSVGRGSPHLQG